VGQKIPAQTAAAELGISLRQIRRMISSGELRAYRVGKTRAIRVDRADLDALLVPVVPEAVRR
jgi:excisionase family DNA binding protein